ncbi:hypothetical protein D3C71_2221230 [compost metagenome]
MAHTFRHQRVKLILLYGELAQFYIAQRGFTEELRPGFTLLAARVVFASYQAAAEV